MSYHYIVTAQKPTAVTACVTGKKIKVTLIKDFIENLTISAFEVMLSGFGI